MPNTNPLVDYYSFMLEGYSVSRVSHPVKWDVYRKDVWCGTIERRDTIYGPRVWWTWHDSKLWNIHAWQLIDEETIYASANK